MNRAALKNQLMREAMYCYHRGRDDGIDQAKRIIETALSDPDLARQLNALIDRVVDHAKREHKQQPAFMDAAVNQ